MDVNFNVAFASNATKSSISEETWTLGWVEVVGGINGVPTAQQFNEVCYVIDVKANLAYKKAQEAMALATKTEESLGNYAPKDHDHSIDDIEDFPESLPANGGDADTVNGHTVGADIPADAQFTDTVYTHPTYTARTGAPTANQTPAFGGTFSVTQPVSDGSGHITGMNSRTVTIPATEASATTPGLMNTGAQTFAGAKTFNDVVDFNGASAIGTAQGRNIYATTTDLEAGVTALETGAICLVYE